MTMKPPHSKRIVVQGIKGLAKLLQSEKRRFAAAPILLIESSTGGGDLVEQSCKQVHFVLAQQLALRTVVSSSLQDAAFPTVGSGISSLVQQQQELAARVGAATICAVGTEAAMHLGKAVAVGDATTGGGGMDELILVPTTYPATLASTMAQSLLLDTHEETLVPSTRTAASPDLATATTTLVAPSLPLDKASVNSSAVNEAAFGALSLCLSRAYQGKDNAHNVDIVHKLETFATCLEQEHYQDASQALFETLWLTGEDLSWGKGTDDGGRRPRRRDVPLAISVSLLPKIFPDSNHLAIWASLASTLAASDNKGGTEISSTALLDLYTRLEKLLGKPAPLVSNQSTDSLLKIVRNNQTSWNCLDAPKDIMSTRLRSFSLVDS